MLPYNDKFTLMNKTTKISIAFFFIALSLLLQYLIYIRNYIYISSFFFWATVIIIFGCIFYQLFKVEITNKSRNIMMLEVSLTACAFHLIYEIPYYGLRDTDVYHDLNSMKGILLTGFIRGDPHYIDYASYFPIVHLLGAQLSLLTGLCPFDVAKWLPSFIGITFPIMLYLLFLVIFKNEKISLLSTLLYICMQNNILLGALFIRENIAIMFLVLFIYLYFSIPSSKNTLLALIFMISITLSHHLTSFILLIFFIIYMFITNFVYPYCKNLFSKNVSPERKFNKNILLLVCIVPFSYWIFVALQPLIVIRTFLKGLVYGDSSLTYAQVADISFSSILSIRGYILYIGFYFFNIIFGVILLYQLMPNIKKKIFEIYPFTIFHLFMGIVGFLFLYFIPTKVALLFPDRFLAYGWLFGFAPLAIFIDNLKNKRVYRIGVLLLFLYLFYNIYSIETPAWDPNHKDIAIAPSQEDYAFAENHAFAEQFSFNNDSLKNNIYLCSFQNTLMAIYDKRNYLGTDLNTIDNEYRLNNFNWIIINKKDFEFKRNKLNSKGFYFRLLNIDNETYLNKVYDTNNIASYSQK